MNITQILAKSG